jgi:hypothetical protein
MQPVWVIGIPVVLLGAAVGAVPFLFDFFNWAGWFIPMGGIVGGFVFGVAMCGLLYFLDEPLPEKLRRQLAGVAMLALFAAEVGAWCSID